MFALFGSDFALLANHPNRLRPPARCRQAKSGGVTAASGVKAAGRTPGPACWIVEFRLVARRKIAYTPFPQYHPGGQQDQPAVASQGTARKAPGPARWIVEFRKLRPSSCRHTRSYYEELAARQQGRPVDTKYAIEVSGESSRSQLPDHTPPHSKLGGNEAYRVHLQPAPCRWVATSLCGKGAGYSSSPWQSKSRSPGCTAPRRLSTFLKCPPTTKTFPLGQKGSPCAKTRAQSGGFR